MPTSAWTNITRRGFSRTGRRKNYARWEVKLGQLCGGRTPSWGRRARHGWATSPDWTNVCSTAWRTAQTLQALRAEQHQSLRDGLGLQSGILVKGKPLSDYFDKLYLSYQIGWPKPTGRFWLPDSRCRHSSRQNRSSLTTGQATYRQPASWVSDLLPA